MQVSARAYSKATRGPLGVKSSLHQTHSGHSFKAIEKESSFICLATGGADKPPSGGGPPGKPPGGPEDPSGAGDHDPDDDEVVHLEEVSISRVARWAVRGQSVF